MFSFAKTGFTLLITFVLPFSSQASAASEAISLEEKHLQYDPAERMLQTPFGSPGYHTTLTGGMVHSTRSSLSYAVACLDTGDAELEKRAEAILDRLVDLQDQDPTSKTCGVWPWFLEEPLSKMSPPDMNWADFCGAQLLEALHNYEARLPSELIQKLDRSLLRAARAIEKRNVGPHYTNIAIMGAYVTLAVAERQKLPDLRDYAIRRWEHFHQFTMKLGGFVEYNSPTYTVVALTELGRFRKYIKDNKARRMADDIYRLAWEEIALHFHPPTRQWAGPHSRAYDNFLEKDVLSLIERGTENRVDFGGGKAGLESKRIPLPCPPDLEKHFSKLDLAITRSKKFDNSDAPVIGTTYLAPDFSLGSVNYGNFWVQQHAVIAYWGTAEEPSYLRVRLLLNGKDFSGAQVFSNQKQGDLLSVVNFSTNGGITHPSLNPIKDHKIQASDLRLCFEFGGSNSDMNFVLPETPYASFRVSSGNIDVGICVPIIEFAGVPARWETRAEKRNRSLDLVLFSGEPKIFDLASMENACAAFALRIRHGESKSLETKAQITNGKIHAISGELGMSASTKPGLIKELRAAAVPSSH